MVTVGPFENHPPPQHQGYHSTEEVSGSGSGPGKTVGHVLLLFSSWQAIVQLVGWLRVPGPPPTWCLETRDNPYHSYSLKKVPTSLATGRKACDSHVLKISASPWHTHKGTSSAPEPHDTLQSKQKESKHVSTCSHSHTSPAMARPASHSYWWEEQC